MLNGKSRWFSDFLWNLLLPTAFRFNDLLSGPYDPLLAMRASLNTRTCLCGSNLGHLKMGCS